MFLEIEELEIHDSQDVTKLYALFHLILVHWPVTVQIFRRIF